MIIMMLMSMLLYVVDDVCADVVHDIAMLSQLLVPLRCHGADISCQAHGPQSVHLCGHR